MKGSVNITPGSVGYCETVLLAGDGVLAVDLLVAVGRLHCGVAHAELHVAVEPCFIGARRVAAEIDFESCAGTHFCANGANETWTREEINSLLWLGSDHWQRNISTSIGAWWIVLIGLDFVNMGFRGRGVDDLDNGVARIVIGDANGRCQREKGGCCCCREK